MKGNRMNRVAAVFRVLKSRGVTRSIVLVALVCLLWIAGKVLFGSSASTLTGPAGAGDLPRPLSLRGADAADVEALYEQQQQQASKTDPGRGTGGDGEGSARSTDGTIFDFDVLTMHGTKISLVKYRDKRAVFLVVNVASQCGHTERTYTQLQELYEHYRDQGLEILAFPCNQFKHQEPGSDREIRKFAYVEYGVTFPLFSKIAVNGPDQVPLPYSLSVHL